MKINRKLWYLLYCVRIVRTLASAVTRTFMRLNKILQLNVVLTIVNTAGASLPSAAIGNVTRRAKTSLDSENLTVENVTKSTTVELNEGFTDMDTLPSASSRATQPEPADETVLCDQTAVNKTDVKSLDFRGLLRTFGIMCFKCGYTFKSRAIYLRHYTQCRYKCRVKQRTSPEEYHYLANHIESSPGKRFSCTLCNNCTVSRYSDVYKHIRLKHGIPDCVSAGTVTCTNKEKCGKSD